MTCTITIKIKKMLNGKKRFLQSHLCIELLAYHMSARQKDAQLILMLILLSPAGYYVY